MPRVYFEKSNKQTSEQPVKVYGVTFLKMGFCCKLGYKLGLSPLSKEWVFIQCPGLYVGCINYLLSWNSQRK